MVRASIRTCHASTSSTRHDSRCHTGNTSDIAQSPPTPDTWAYRKSARHSETRPVLSDMPVQHPELSTDRDSQFRPAVGLSFTWESRVLTPPRRLRRIPSSSPLSQNGERCRNAMQMAPDALPRTLCCQPARRRNRLPADVAELNRFTNWWMCREIAEGAIPTASIDGRLRNRYNSREWCCHIVKG